MTWRAAAAAAAAQSHFAHFLCLASNQGGSDDEAEQQQAPMAGKGWTHEGRPAIGGVMAEGLLKA